MYGDAYRRGHDRVVRFVRGRDLTVAVPATPDWTALDVLRHLAGVSQDIIDGVVDGFASDEWTAQQVTDRRSMTYDEVLDAWDVAIGPASERLDALQSSGAEALVPSPLGHVPARVLAPMAISDILHHEFDLRNAYGDRAGRDLMDIHVAAAGAVRALRPGFTQAGLPTLRVHSTDSGMGWDVGYDEPAATLDATSFELLRSIGGRRTREEVLALDWTGDPELFVDAMVLPHLRMRSTSLGE